MPKLTRQEIGNLKVGCKVYLIYNVSNEFYKGYATVIKNNEYELSFETINKQCIYTCCDFWIINNSRNKKFYIEIFIGYPKSKYQFINMS